MQHTCSMCGTTYEFEWAEGTPLPKSFPFCSARCKAADLGKWMNEEYFISTPLPGMMSDTERELLVELGKSLDDDTE